MFSRPLNQVLVVSGQTTNTVCVCVYVCVCVCVFLDIYIYIYICKDKRFARPRFAVLWSDLSRNHFEALVADV